MDNDSLWPVKSRQTLADSVLGNRTTQLQIFKRWLIHNFRILVFYSPFLRRLVERPTNSPDANKVHWDSLLSQTRFSTYLGGTINVDGANLITSLLVKFHANDSPSILDIGCCGGTLVCALPTFSRYFGMDVSRFAIDAAQKMATEMLPNKMNVIGFEAADLRQFTPPDVVDVIIFNEVLYYLNTSQAITEVQRYAKSLSDNGLVIISMKDDGKSRAIFRLLSQKFDWVDGILWQRKATSFDYAVRANRERPAFLVGALKLR